jgi:hypothetical protein
MSFVLFGVGESRTTGIKKPAREVIPNTCSEAKGGGIIVQQLIQSGLF